MAGAVLPEDACGEPGDVGVYRDLDDGVGGAVVCPARAAAEHPGEGPGPGAGGELVQPLPLARDPGAAAQGLVNGAGGVLPDAQNERGGGAVDEREASAIRSFRRAGCSWCRRGAHGGGARGGESAPALPAGAAGPGQGRGMPGTGPCGQLPGAGARAAARPKRPRRASRSSSA